MNDTNKYKKWGLLVILASLIVLSLFIGIVVYVDPYFQYHAPRDELSYIFADESFVNAGMAKSFEYDAILTGTSMASNFLATDMDRIFDCTSIKAIYRGGYPADFKMLLDFALKQKPVKTVIWGIDPNSYLNAQIDKHRIENTPHSLYDNIIFNDLDYLLNKEMFLKYIVEIINRTSSGIPGETLDSYTYFANDMIFAKAYALAGYARPEQNKAPQPEDLYLAAVTEQFEKNIEPILKAYPDTQFYMFTPPYSILWWDSEIRKGTVQAAIKGYFELMRKILSYPNVKFSFFIEHTPLTTDLDQYTDAIHYNSNWNLWMLEEMKSESFRITLDNLDQKQESLRDFVFSYDFSPIFPISST